MSLRVPLKAGKAACLHAEVLHHYLVTTGVSARRRGNPTKKIEIASFHSQRHLSKPKFGIHRIAPVAAYPAGQQIGIICFSWWISRISLTMIKANPSHGSSTRIRIVNVYLSFLNYKCNKNLECLRKVKNLAHRAGL